MKSSLSDFNPFIWESEQMSWRKLSWPLGEDNKYCQLALFLSAVKSSFLDQLQISKFKNTKHNFVSGYNDNKKKHILEVFLSWSSKALQLRVYFAARFCFGCFLTKLIMFFIRYTNISCSNKKEIENTSSVFPQHLRWFIMDKTYPDSDISPCIIFYWNETVDL